MVETTQWPSESASEEQEAIGSQNTIGIVQARTASSRLPGKVLLDIAGKPMFARVVNRLRRAHSINQVVVATTTDPSDDPLVKLCNEYGYPVYRGSQFDVLDRFYQTAKMFAAEVIVRVTADCPLIDPGVVDLTVGEFVKTGVDFAANRLPPPWRRTYPIGLDVEVCTFKALERAWRTADQPLHREHVMPYLYEQEGRFKTLQVNHDPDYGHLRWTVDTAEDLELVRCIYDHFGRSEDFSWLEVLDLFERMPELAEINAKVRHNTLFDVDKRQK